MLSASKCMDTIKQQFPRRWIKAFLLGQKLLSHVSLNYCNAEAVPGVGEGWKCEFWAKFEKTETI